MGKSKEILKIGVFILFLTLVFLSTLLSLTFEDRGETALDGTQSGGDDLNSKKDVWDEYTNEEFKVSFTYPKLLLKREYKNQGGYDFFVRFEENELAMGKGVAMGVNGDGLDAEVKKLKESMTANEQAVISLEEEVNIDGVRGIKLDFEPKSVAAGEKRSVLVFERRGFTYSLSTVPGQMQRIIDSIKFF